MMSRLLILLFLSFPFLAYAQQEKLVFHFEKDSTDVFGIDTVQKVNYNSSKKYIHISKAVAKNTVSKVIMVIDSISQTSATNLNFKNESNNQLLSFYQRAKNKVVINLTEAEKEYTILVQNNDKTIASILVYIFDKTLFRIQLVPTNQKQIKIQQIEKELNRIYSSVMFEFKLELAPIVKIQNTESLILDNPQQERLAYTKQMHILRDELLKAIKGKTLTFLLIDRFVNMQTNGFSVKSKALGFLKYETPNSMARAIAQEFAFGFADIKTNTKDTLAQFKNDVINNQNAWQKLKNLPETFSFYDDYENVASSNGLIAFYLWKTNKDGSIKIINGDFGNSIRKPFKKNTFSYHLELKHFFYKILFTVKSLNVNLLHFLSIILIIFSWYKFRHKLKESRIYIKCSESFVLKSLLRFGLLLFACSFIFFLWFLIEKGYSLYEVKAGKIQEYSSMKYSEVIQSLSESKHPKRKAEKAIGSEIVTKKGLNYDVKHEGPVCYFSAIEDRDHRLKSLRFVYSKYTLNLRSSKKTIPAFSHYQIVDYFNENGSFLYQKIFNHAGDELTNKLKLEDAPKRILLFVNGYRPTSLGNSLEQNIADIGKKGLEFPDSYNNLYNYDRYNYWNPWGQIDQLFSKRINPAENYYADGHHSVETSNHLSLFNFSSLSAIYPKRCKNTKKHKCYSSSTVEKSLFGSKNTPTYSLHRTKPNYKGFNQRKANGEIAGRNLLQILNELPNGSQNDTLVIVAHSMGFAYATGIVESMRGKINFGEFYIIAPENAKAGKVNSKEWKIIYQYGSNFNKGEREAPCLQDGVAPQASVDGISAAHRIYIPKINYSKKGFFDSHFIGYYTWILQIAQGEKGEIVQH